MKGVLNQLAYHFQQADRNDLDFHDFIFFQNISLYDDCQIRRVMNGEEIKKN